MADNIPPTLPYARSDLEGPKPTHHSSLAGWAWGMVSIEMSYRGSVVAYAYHRSPTYPWLRFRRNVGDSTLFIEIDQAMFCIGALISIAALIPRNRKRWAAWSALVVHLLLLAIVSWVLATSRY